MTKLSLPVSLIQRLNGTLKINMKLTILNCCGIRRLVPVNEVEEFYKLCDDLDTTGVIAELISKNYPMLRTYVDDTMLVWKEGRFVLSYGEPHDIMIHPSHTWLQNKDVEIIETWQES